MQQTFRYRPAAPSHPRAASFSASHSDVVLAGAPQRDARTDGDRLATHRWAEGQSNLIEDDGEVPSLPGFADLQLLGRGGMGLVYRARQVNLARDVAIKLILSGAGADEQQRLRFQFEAEAIARLAHPNVVQIYQVGQADGADFLVLELVEGGTLREWVEGKPQPPREAAALIETLARAVHQAHLRGVVHRDLKPDNVLLTPDGVPKISDFGLAKHTGRSGDPLADAVVGTAAYMSPEQAWGSSRLQEIGPAADVYSLGAMLYELLAGAVPFRGNSLTATLKQVWSAPPPSVRERVPGCAADLESICLRCLAKQPEARYASAAELANDLRRFLQHEPVGARPVGPLTRLAKWSRRRPAAAALAAVSIAASLLIVGGGVSYHTRLARALTEAQANLHSAQDAVDELLVKVGTQKLAPLANSAGVQRGVLEAAAGFCQSFLKQYPRDERVRIQAARAQRQLGDIHFLLGQISAAGRDYDRAIALGRELVAAPRSASSESAGLVRRELAVAYNNRGNLAQREGELSRADADYAEAFRLWEPLVAGNPNSGDYLRGLAAAQSNLGLCEMALGHFSDAEGLFTSALESASRLAEAAPAETSGLDPRVSAQNNLGSLMFARGQYQAALGHFGQALKFLESRPADRQPLPEERLALVTTRHNLAAAHVGQGNLTAARQELAEALTGVEGLQRDFPELSGVAEQHAAVLAQSARVNDDSLNGPTRDALLSEAAGYLKNAAQSAPSPQTGAALAACLQQRAALLAADDDLSHSGPLLQEAHRLLQKLAEKHADQPDYASQYASLLHAEAEWLARQDQHEAAVKRLFKAAELQKQALDANRQHAAYAPQLRRHYALLGQELIDLGRAEEAVEVAGRLAALPKSSAGDRFQAASLLARCVPLATGLKGGDRSPQPGVSLDEYCARRAVELLNSAVDEGLADAPERLSAAEELAPLRQRSDFARVLAKFKSSPDNARLQP